jgi:MoaA/NifB/PqqE/SkfB family radical SAM enzyme
MGITWGQLGNNLVDEAKKRGIPLSGQFELTPRCNLKCKMCYICRPANDNNALSKELTADEWISIASQARDAGMLYLLLTGGEVFLRKDFQKIYEEISSMGFITEIFTNATLITPEKAKWLASMPPTQVEVTLYGASANTYSRVCGHADGFERTLQGVDALLSEGINVKLRTTIIRENVRDYDEMMRIAESRRLQLGIVNYISPRREGDNTCPNQERLSPEEIVKFEAYVLGYMDVSGNLILKDKQQFEDKKPKNEVKHTKSSKLDQCFYCEAGKSSFSITWDGRMATCSQMSSSLTSPLDVGFNTSWSELKQFCKTMPRCSKCIYCDYQEYCMTCPARLKNETGQYDKSAEYLCKSAKERARIVNALVK